MTQPGFSEARLGRLQSIVEGYVTRGVVPGVITLVSRRGDTRVDVFGSKAEDGKDPLRRDSIFRISSMTKPITAVATLILVEECKLRLDDAIDRWLPEMSDRRILKRIDGPLHDTIPTQRPISVRDLLTFRMGFGQQLAPPDATPLLKTANDLQIGMGPPNPASMPAPDEWIRRLGTLPLMSQPGEKWHYHTGADVLSVLVARASGQPFETFLRERIFEPLGMKDTSFSVPAEKLERLATSYLIHPQSGALQLFDAAKGGQWSQPAKFQSGGGGLCSTVDDFFAFSDMLLGRGRRGDVRILSRPAVDLMTSDHLTPAQRTLSGWVPGYFENRSWGFGVAVTTRRDNTYDSVGAYGWDGGLGTIWRNDPQEELITLLFSQTAWSSPTPPDLCRDFWTSAYQAIAD